MKKSLAFFELALGIALLLGSAYTFQCGFHDVDLSMNLLKISCQYDLDYENWVDMYKINKTISYDESYIVGQDYMFYASIGMLLSGILIGSSIVKFQYLLKDAN